MKLCLKYSRVQTLFFRTWCICCHFYSKQNGAHGLIPSNLIGRMTSVYHSTGLGLSQASQISNRLKTVDRMRGLSPANHVRCLPCGSCKLSSAKRRSSGFSSRRRLNKMNNISNNGTVLPMYICRFVRAWTI